MEFLLKKAKILIGAAIILIGAVADCKYEHDTYVGRRECYVEKI